MSLHLSFNSGFADAEFTRAGFTNGRKILAAIALSILMLPLSVGEAHAWQPGLHGPKEVRNVTAGETNFAESTRSYPGDVVEFRYRACNPAPHGNNPEGNYLFSTVGIDPVPAGIEPRQWQIRTDLGTIPSGGACSRYVNVSGKIIKTRPGQIVNQVCIEGKAGNNETPNDQRKCDNATVIVLPRKCVRPRATLAVRDRIWNHDGPGDFRMSRAVRTKRGTMRCKARKLNCSASHTPKEAPRNPNAQTRFRLRCTKATLARLTSVRMYIDGELRKVLRIDSNMSETVRSDKLGRMGRPLNGWHKVTYRLRGRG